MEQAAGCRSDGGASITTYLHPFIRGAMRRELERSLFPLAFSKRAFVKQIGEKSLAFVSLNELWEDEGSEIPRIEPVSLENVEHTVYTKIYINLLKQEFERLPFKDREILGAYYGVFGYAEQPAEELAFAFQMKESAVLKA